MVDSMRRKRMSKQHVPHTGTRHGDILGTADTEQALSVREVWDGAASHYEYVWLMNRDKIPLKVKLFRNKLYFF